MMSSRRSMLFVVDQSILQRMHARRVGKDNSSVDNLRRSRKDIESPIKAATQINTSNSTIELRLAVLQALEMKKKRY